MTDRGLVEGENTPDKNKKAIRKLRLGEGPGSGQKGGDSPDRKRPKGNRSFVRKGD